MKELQKSIEFPEHEIVLDITFFADGYEQQMNISHAFGVESYKHLNIREIEWDFDLPIHNTPENNAIMEKWFEENYSDIEEEINQL